MVSVVPALKARVLAMAFVKNNAKLQGFIEHPAGPFTSESSSGLGRLQDLGLI